MVGPSNPIMRNFSPENLAMTAKDILNIHRWVWPTDPLGGPIERRRGRCRRIGLDPADY